MKRYNILTILISHRIAKATEVQSLLTKYGCHIKMRLGLHETSSLCAEDGLLILELDDEQDVIRELNELLNKIDGVKTELISIESN